METNITTTPSELITPVFDKELPVQVFSESTKKDLPDSVLSSITINDFLLNIFKQSQHTEDNNMKFSTFFDNFKNSIMSQDNSQLIDMTQLEEFASKYFKLLEMSENMIDCTIDTNESILGIQKDIQSKGCSQNSDSNNSLLKANPNPPANSSPKLKPLIEDETNMRAFTKSYLFRDLQRDFVCRVCFKPGNVFKCEGICCGWYHKDCCKNNNNIAIQSNISHINNAVQLDLSQDHGMCNELDDIDLDKTSTIPSSTGFMCDDCFSGTRPACYICFKYHDQPENRIRCKYNGCGRYYHEKCLKYFPQAKILSVNYLRCPMHCCHTCISDDPRSMYTKTNSGNLIRCIKCPATYHMDSTCIPAGTDFITAQQIICPKHRPKLDRPINANWCFICTKGGHLICCETCPTAFHMECLNINIEEDEIYICEECETGRMPLYGEVVWAKFARYRWWPSQIIPPSAIPDNIEKLPQKQFDFCIRFFGAHNYTWLNRDRVYLYQEGDWDNSHITGDSLNSSYKKALIEAKDLYDRLKEMRMKKHSEQSDKLKPIPYIKIVVNKPIPPVKLVYDDLCDINTCNCSADMEHPCGPYAACINRILMFECNPKVCPAGDKCENQLFEKRIYPKLEVVKTDFRGFGLYAMEDISSGTFIVEYVGEIIDDNEFRSRVERKEREKDENYYFLTISQQLTIDAGPRGNVARFMNHSCEPNCETQKWNVNGVTRVGLFAIKDISKVSS